MRQTRTLSVFTRAARKAGISVASWCREVPVSRVHLYLVLRGVRKPGPALAAKIDRFIRHYGSGRR